jgi:hypothetical protein
MDAELLSSISADWLFRRPASLFQVFDRMDWDTGQIPTYDEASYGLARLVARGYITATYLSRQGIRLKATPRGVGLRRVAGKHARQIYRRRLPYGFQVTAVIAQLAGAAGPSVGDISFGRLPELTEQIWQSEVDAYVRDGELWIERARHIGGLGRLFRMFLRWRHPEYFDDGPA